MIEPPAKPGDRGEEKILSNPVRLGGRLKLARQTRGLTLKALAQAADCSESLLSKIENGKASPSLPMLHKLVGVLGTNIGWMFEEADGEEGIVFRSGTRPLIGLDPLRRGKASLSSGLFPTLKAICSSATSTISRREAKAPGLFSMLAKRLDMCLRVRLSSWSGSAPSGWPLATALSSTPSSLTGIETWGRSAPASSGSIRRQPFKADALDQGEWLVPSTTAYSSHLTTIQVT